MRLKSQIFLTLLTTGVILITLMYLISSWSFSRGFLDYINNSERARLTPMLAELGERYAQFGSWDWIDDNGREWRRLIDTHVMMRAPRADKPGQERRRKPPPTARKTPASGNAKNHSEMQRQRLGKIQAAEPYHSHWTLGFCWRMPKNN